MSNMNRTGDVLMVIENNDLFLSVHADDIKMVGKKEEFVSCVEEMDETGWSWSITRISLRKTECSNTGAIVKLLG